MKNSAQDRIFNLIIYTVLGLFLIILVYPLYFILIASFSDPNMVNSGRIVFYPRGITLIGYERVLKDPNILTGYRNTLLYTSIGTSLNIAVTLLAGYALSRKDLKGQGMITKFMVLTMLVNGGIIPLYLVVKQLRLINTFGVMVLPSAVAVWNVIVARTFFSSTIPMELLESAKVDGCSNTKFFLSVVLPLSPALIAVQVLFYGVAHWNSFFHALIFLSDPQRYPLQLILRQILLQNELSQMMQGADPKELMELQMLAESIKFALIIVASAPVMILYPFLQRYFVKGVMIGAIKG